MDSPQTTVESGSLVAHVASFLHDIRMGHIDVLDVFFVFWIIATGLVYVGFTVYDKSRKGRTKNKLEGKQNRPVVVEPPITSSHTSSEHQSFPYHGGQGTGAAPPRWGQNFTSSPGFASTGENTCDWVNGVAQWLYSQQSQCTPQQVSSTWLKALNDEAKRQGSSVQVTFEAMNLGPLPPKFTNITIETEPKNLLTVTCDLEAEGIEFGVFASQHTASAVKVTNCNATVQKLSGKVQCIIRQFGEDWHITATLEEETVLHLKITPQITQNENVDIHAVEEIIRNAILSATFTTVIPTRALPKDMATIAWSRPRPPMNDSSFRQQTPQVAGQMSNHVSQRVQTPQEPRLLVRVIKANNLQRQSGDMEGDPYCVVTLDQPFQRYKTKFIKNTTNPFWDEQFLFQVNTQSKEITFEVHDRGKDDRFQGGTTLPLPSVDRSRGSRHIIQLQSRPGQNDNIKGSIVLFLLFMQTPDTTAKKPLSPSRQVEKKQMLAPDGTIITTVTTKTSRPKFLSANNNEIPTKVHTNTTQMVEHAPPLNGSMSPGSPDKEGYWTPTSGTPSNGVTPEVPQDSGRDSPNSRQAVADTAIRHFQEQALDSSRQKTPTKKSTLIIHGVSESPTDDYSNLQDSTDDSKLSERNDSSRASRRRFLFFRRKSKDGGKDGGKGGSRSSSFDESSLSSRSPEPQLRRAKTLDIPDSDMSDSITSEKSPKKKKRRFLGFIRRKKPKERQYHSSINLKTETAEEGTVSDTPTTAMKKSGNTLKVPATNQYTRSASTGDIKYERYLTVETEHFRPNPVIGQGSQTSVDRISYTESNV